MNRSVTRGLWIVSGALVIAAGVKLLVDRQFRGQMALLGAEAVHRANRPAGDADNTAVPQPLIELLQRDGWLTREGNSATFHSDAMGTYVVITERGAVHFHEVNGAFVPLTLDGKQLGTDISRPGITYKQFTQLLDKPNSPWSD